MGVKISCECTKCDCQKIFEVIETEELINLIQHGRLNSEQILFLKTQIESKICIQCFVKKHHI